MSWTSEDSFGVFLKQQEQRIHYHIHDLDIKDPFHAFYLEGVYALWKWWKIEQTRKGSMVIDIDSMIRIHLMELCNKKQI